MDLYHIARRHANDAGYEMFLSAEDFAAHTVDNDMRAMKRADETCRKTIETSLAGALLASNIVVYQPLTSRFGSLGVLAKRVIRKVTRFYVEPMLQNQVRFNQVICETLAQMNARFSILEADLEQEAVRRVGAPQGSRV